MLETLAHRLEPDSDDRRRHDRQSRLGFPPPPTSAPIPTAMPTYTAVMNTASDLYTRVRLMTMSMSYRRYLNMAMPVARGKPDGEAPVHIDAGSLSQATMVHDGAEAFA